MPRTKKIVNYPLVALRGKVVFPGTTANIDVGRLISLTAVSRASERDMTLFVSLQTDMGKEDIVPADVCKVGCAVRIKQIAKLPSNNLRLSVEGLYRAKAEEVYEEDGCLFANVAELKAAHGDPVLEEAYFRTAQEVLRELASGDARLAKEAASVAEAAGDADAFIDRALADPRGNQTETAGNDQRRRAAQTVRALPQRRVGDPASGKKDQRHRAAEHR